MNREHSLGVLPADTPRWGCMEGSRVQGPRTYLVLLLGDVESIQCEDGFPGTHVQGVLVLTQQQGRVVEDARLIKLHQTYLCGRQGASSEAGKGGQR